ncbi:hypothetical protein P7K49_024696 [Saguinus oedipus]|uniref:Uncharacterized protein n=1 Tax=Saguinus oedipus TaxID=9490 RepID=A0ABQ9UQ90_SAGOE|nr:hypothetical protein P7K49_024696 [Saguinus oedipus]
MQSPQTPARCWRGSWSRHAEPAEPSQVLERKLEQTRRARRAQPGAGEEAGADTQSPQSPARCWRGRWSRHAEPAEPSQVLERKLEQTRRTRRAQPGAGEEAGADTQNPQSPARCWRGSWSRHAEPADPGQVLERKLEQTRRARRPRPGAGEEAGADTQNPQSPARCWRGSWSRHAEPTEPSQVLERKLEQTRRTRRAQPGAGEEAGADTQNPQSPARCWRGSWSRHAEPAEPSQVLERKLEQTRRTRRAQPGAGEEAGADTQSPQSPARCWRGSWSRHAEPAEPSQVLERKLEQTRRARRAQPGAGEEAGADTQNPQSPARSSQGPGAVTWIYGLKATQKQALSTQTSKCI